MKEVADLKITTAKGTAATYSGTLNARGKPHGWGTLAYEDGHLYEGDFQNGVRHGQVRAALHDRIYRLLFCAAILTNNAPPR